MKYNKEYSKIHKQEIIERRKIYYQEHKEEILKKVSKFKKSFDGTIKAKIVCSKQDDLKYNRENDIDEDFVKYLLEIQELKCLYCDINLKLEWDEPYDKEQFSINRLNNKIGHIKNNCEITCWGCNDYLGRLDKIK